MVDGGQIHQGIAYVRQAPIRQLGRNKKGHGALALGKRKGGHFKRGLFIERISGIFETPELQQVVEVHIAFPHSGVF